MIKMKEYPFGSQIKLGALLHIMKASKTKHFYFSVLKRTWHEIGTNCVINLGKNAKKQGKQAHNQKAVSQLKNDVLSLKSFYNYCESLLFALAMKKKQTISQFYMLCLFS